MKILLQPRFPLFYVIPMSFIKHCKKPDHIHRTKSFLKRIHSVGMNFMERFSFHCYSPQEPDRPGYTHVQ